MHSEYTSNTDSLNPEGQAPVFISPTKRLARLYPQTLSSLFIASESEPESESYFTTDGQPASLSWNKAPFWGLRPDLHYCLTVAGLLIWGTLSDERMGLSFSLATGPRQRSHFRVQVP
jgi:hypothetical protein